jgi:nitroimidazol reductase NimA-like FMN-containing flavoprotein (pyridoxamine 5'-phosphate oxidase superfamily)
MEPTASRPHMPGYGIAPADGAAGLLPWSWAEERLTSSHNYWLATVSANGRPHAMPLWGIWIDGGCAFSTGGRSVKARNLRANPACVVTTENAAEPVVVEGVATPVDDVETARRVSEAYAAKYGAAPPDVTESPLFLVRPQRVIALIEREDEFTRTATRWTFPESGSG